MSYKYQRKTELRPSELVSMALNYISPDSTWGESSVCNALTKALAKARRQHKAATISPQTFHDMCVVIYYLGNAMTNLTDKDKKILNTITEYIEG
jgi:hypothetical protein